MKTALLFIATVSENLEEEIEEQDHPIINDFLLSLSKLGYRISDKDGQMVEYINDIPDDEFNEEEEDDDGTGY